jgi:hypothetical protein
VKTVETPAPKAKDVRLCADIRPTPALPQNAGLVASVGPVEIAAVRAFLNAVADLVDHDKEMMDRAALAKAETCGVK